MKKFSVLVVLILAVFSAESKIVKFSVDMTGQTVSPLGVHITGDFQEVAGFPGGNWQSNTSPMTNEAGTDIYSIVVDIPAHTKYEFKFVNGDQFYEVEFVPYQSRVIFEFNDSRWAWIDSLNADTTVIGPLLFGGNAPQGKFLLRFNVDPSSETAIDPFGIHVSGNFQGWNQADNRMFSFDGTIYEEIMWLDPGTYEFKYFNGILSTQFEIVPAACAQSGNRFITLSADTILDVVCFSNCGPCVASVEEQFMDYQTTIFPNPVSNQNEIEVNSKTPIESIIVLDPSGRMIRYIEYDNELQLKVDCLGMEAGMFFLIVQYSDNRFETKKLLVY